MLLHFYFVIVEFTVQIFRNQQYVPSPDHMLLTVIQSNWGREDRRRLLLGCGGRDDLANIELCQTVLIIYNGTKLFPFTLTFWSQS